MPLRIALLLYISREWEGLLKTKKKGWRSFSCQTETSSWCCMVQFPYSPNNARCASRRVVIGYFAKRLVDKFEWESIVVTILSTELKNPLSWQHHYHVDLRAVILLDRLCKIVLWDTFRTWFMRLNVLSATNNVAWIIMSSFYYVHNTEEMASSIASWYNTEHCLIHFRDFLAGVTWAGTSCKIVSPVDAEESCNTCLKQTFIF